MASSKEVITNIAKDFLTFIQKSPTPYHAVDEFKKLLVSAGFKELQESEHWQTQQLHKCFITRNHSTLVAFARGGKYTPGNGFSLIGAHTDSPCLKVKPVSRRVKQGYAQVGVECYGGGIWSSWFDRDLKIAGRVIVKQSADSHLEHRLVNVDRPILRVPHLAIHLNRELGEKFDWNKENHLLPVLATSVQEQLDTGSKSSAEVPEGGAQHDKHHPLLIRLLCDEMGIKPEQIVDFELCLADASPPTLGGALNEFIFSPRLDNLHSSYCAIQALIKSSGDGGSLQEDTNIRIVSLFDNEEVGSESAQGACSALLEHVLRRLSETDAAFSEAVPKSLLLSADMAHAVHPNYAEKHEEQHRPDLHKGIVVKYNGNQRYATTAITRAILRDIAAKINVPLQDFAVRNDMPCGSTIGPIISARVALPTVDVGAPQLSMHSIREMCGANSVKQAIDLFQGFFDHYSSVQAASKI